MKQWLKDFTHNVLVHPMMMFMPKAYANKLHAWNATWAFGLERYNEINLEGMGVGMNDGVGIARTHTNEGIGLIRN